MPAMTIRKLSEAAVQSMKVRAKANGRSVEAEARLALEERFAMDAKPLRTVADVIDEVKRKIGGGIDIPMVARSKEPPEPADFG